LFHLRKPPKNKSEQYVISSAIEKNSHITKSTELTRSLFVICEFMYPVKQLNC